MSEAYGIDLGTTYSAIAQMGENGTPEIIQNMDGGQTTPSVVYFEGPGAASVGEIAKRSAVSEPEETCMLIKRHMGTEYPQEYQGETYTPEGISALILRSLVEGANASTGQDIDQVVITVPAYFGSQEREATKQAGQIAHLDVIGIVTEPVAAALSIGLDSDADETIMVYDLGGGTFDTTIMRLQGGNVEVMAVEGDRELGGADWDSALLGIVADKFVEETGIDDDPLSDEDFAVELQLKVEDAKKSLTARELSTPINLQYEGSKASVKVSREEFEEATSHLIDRTIEISKRCVEIAKEKDPNLSIDRVLLVGGSSRMPMVSNALKAQLDWDAQPTDFDLAVAKGASIYADKVLKGELITEAVDESGQPVMPGLGGAAHGGTVIKNVLSRSVGIRLVRGGNVDDVYIEFIAHSNDQIPMTPEPITAGTVVDDQSSCNLAVYEQAGDVESEAVEDNRLLKEAELEIPVRNLPKGSPIELEFSISNEGLITVRSTEPQSGNSIELEAAVSILSKEDVEAETQKVSALTLSI